MNITKAINLFFIILIALAVILRFYTYFVSEEFLVSAYIPCDPSIHSCFIVNDPEFIVFDYQTSPYKKIEANSDLLPECVFEHNCISFNRESQPEYEITYCSDDVLEDGEVCLVDDVLE